ncbi:MAG: hypothetical protein H0Z40_10600 [Desulfotomaculum sp.]|nr:hypothetical protein [Desulfotomaculum sp.]
MQPRYLPEKTIAGKFKERRSVNTLAVLRPKAFVLYTRLDERMRQGK